MTYCSLSYFYSTLQNMGITKVTTNSRYAMLHDDVSFFVQYESPLTEEEINTTWEIFVLLFSEDDF